MCVDSGVAALGSWDGCRLFNTGPSGAVKGLFDHASLVSAIALATRHRLLLAGGDDALLTAWDTESGERICTLEGHTDWVTSITVAGDGRFALSGSRDGTVRLWDIPGECCLRVFAGCDCAVWAVACDEGVGRAYAAGADGRVRVWDTATGRCSLVLDERNGALWTLALNDAHRLLATGCDNGAIGIWSLATGRRLTTIAAHTSAVRALALSADARILASAGDDRAVKLWSVDGGDLLWTSERSMAVSAVALASDCSRLYAWAGHLESWFLDWDIEGHDAREWNEGADLHIAAFVNTVMSPRIALPSGYRPSPREVNAILRDRRHASWKQEEFQRLLQRLGNVGYGWFDASIVQAKLQDAVEQSTHDVCTVPHVANEFGVRECLGLLWATAGHNEPAHGDTVWRPGDMLLERYEIKAVVEGSTNLVCRARNRALDQDFAIVGTGLRWNESGGTESAQSAAIAHWIALGSHPNIAYCFYVRRVGATLSAFVEWVEGGSLRKWMATGALYEGGTREALKRVLDVAIQSAWGLSYLHRCGVVHQKLRPSNILVREDGLVKLTGIGGAVQSAARAWCSPVLVAGGSPAASTDTWSWALIVLTMLRGKEDWADGPAALDSVKLWLGDVAACDTLGRIPDAIVQILRGCFIADPAERPHDMNALADQLEEIHVALTGAPYLRTRPAMPDLAPASLNNWALGLLDLGFGDEGMALLDRALDIDPNFDIAARNRTLALSRVPASRVSNGVGDTKEPSGHWRANLAQAQNHADRTVQGDGCLPTAAPDGTADATGRLPASPTAAPGVSPPVCIAHIDSASPSSPIPPVGFALSDCSAVEGSAVLRSFHKAVRIAHAALDDANPSIALSALTFGRSLPGCHNVGQVLDLWCRLYPYGRGTRFRGANRRVTGYGTSDTIRNRSGTSSTYYGRWASLLLGYGIRYKIMCPDAIKVLDITDDELSLELADWRNRHRHCHLRGHSGPVRNRAVSADGRFGVSGGDDNILRVWDLEAGTCKRELRGHAGHIQSVFICSNGTIAVSGCAKGEVRVWDCVGGDCLWIFGEHTAPIRSVALSGDGHFALSGSEDGTARMYDCKAGKCIQDFRGHSEAVQAVALTPAGDIAVTGGWDNSVRLWSAADGRCLSKLTGHSAKVIVVACSADGLCCASDSIDGTIKLWDVSRGRLLRTLAKDDSPDMDCAAFAPDAQVALVSHGQSAYLLSRGTSKQEVRVTWPAGVTCSASLPARDLAATGDSLGAVRIWDLANQQCITTFNGHRGCVSAVVLDPDRRLALSGGHDATVRLWDITSKYCVRILEGHADWVSCVCLSSGGRLALSASHDESIRIWDTVSGEMASVLRGHEGPVLSLAMGRDGKLLLSAGADCVIRLWEIGTGSCIRHLVGHTREITSLAVSHDGKVAVSASADMTLRIWSLDERRCLCELPLPEMPIAAVLGPDAESVATWAGQAIGWQLDWDLDPPFGEPPGSVLWRRVHRGTR